MAVLLSGTTIGGHVAVHANNISTYALTSIPATISPTNIYVGNAIYFGGANNYFNWDGARINSNVGIQSASDMRAPIFYDSNDTNYYLDPNSTSVLNRVYTTGRLEVTYNTDRYQMNFLRGSGSNWWVTNDSDKLGLHLNNVGDRIYFATDGNIWSAYYNDWLSNIFNSKQNASTAITTSNIGSQSVSYASSAGNADTLDGYHASSLTYVPSWTNNTQNAQRSGFVSGGNWYRVANLGTERFFARVRIYDDSSGGPHSSVEFQVSGAFNNSSNYSFTLTSNGYYSAPSVTQVRILSAGTYDPQYLEVYISYVGYAGSTFAVSLLEARNATVVNWDNGSIPSGYSATTWDANAPLAVGGRAAIFNSGLYNTNDYSRFGNVLVGQGTYKNTIKPIDDANLNIHTPSGAVYFDTFGQASGSFRAPIFYDSNDTGYYLDPNGTSNLLQLTTATRARWNMPRVWYDRSSRTSDQGYWTGTNGWGASDGTWANAWQGGFSGWDIWGEGIDHPQSGQGYVHAQGIVSGQHYATSSVGYGWMMVGAHNATANRYWLRGKWDTTTSSWVEMITTGNIASQSVSYADESGYSASSGSVEWTSVQNKPATFPPSSHTHDDRYYTESESDGRYLIGTTNPGSVANFTISIGNNGSYSYVQSHSGQPLYLNPVGNSIVLNSTTTVAGTAQFNSNTTWFSGRATIGLENQSEFARFAFYGLSLWDWDHGEQMVVDGNYVYVNNYLQAGNSLRAPIFYDSNDTTYYGDFASTSYLRHLSVGDVNASNDGGWNARLNLTGSSHARLDVKSNSDGIITTMYSHTGHGVGRVGTMSNHPLAFMVNGSIASGLIWDSTNGSRFVVGESISTPYTLIDSNKRPVIYARGAYPVLTLDHTETGNSVHGPTIQFVHNGLEGRQFVIGTNGQGTQLDFGYSDTPNYGNTSYNPHNGIGGYTGKTIMRLTTTGLLIGDSGTYPTIRTAARDLDVRGSQNISGFLNVNGATEHTVNDNGSVIHGTTTNNRVFINGSIQLTNNNDAIVIGRSASTFLTDEELGFGWGGGWYMTEGSYIRSRGSKSLHMNGGSVDYVGSLYLEGSVGVHLQPNAGSYGSLQVTGSKDGWHGVRFTGSNVVVMANTNEVGFHNNAAGWQFLWSAGTAYVFKGGTGGGTQATVWDSVNAPRANQSDLMHYEGFTLDANSMRSNSTGFTYAVNAPEVGPIARFSTGGGYDLWINAGYWSGSDLWFRTRNGDTATINAWRRNLNATSDFYAANMNQYVRTSDSVTFGGVTSPIILVNNHSDNTKGYRIHNTSGTSVSAMFTNSSNQLVIAAGAVDQINLNKKVYVNGVALGVNVTPSATAGRIDASNDIVAYSSSDERLKENIAPIENALDKVKSLTGVEFDWKPEYKDAHGYEGHDTGIIAQQVEAVMPSAVRTNDTGFLAVRYEKLIGLLIEGMKEQQAQIDELKAKLDGLTK